MKSKTAVRLATDVLMTLALLFAMGYQVWGAAPHEWAGTGMFLLFIAHHILNAQWHKTLLQGKYNAQRIVTLGIDCLVLMFMLVQMYSGMVMSRYVFQFLPFGGMVWARRLHILGAHWGFLLTSLHLGLHWDMILGISRRAANIKQTSKARRIIAFIIGAVIAGHGAWALADRDFPTYLFLQSEFVFLDYGESPILFYVDYLSLMGFCIFVAHCSTKLMRIRKKKVGKRP